MQRSLLLLSLSLSVVWVGASCGRSGVTSATTKKSGDPTVLAQIDDVTITVGDFEDRINKQSPYIRARYNSPERKKELLEQLVRFEALAKEAARKGYDKDEEVVRTMKQVMIQKLMKDELERIKLEDITDDDSRKYYEEHRDEYNRPEEVRVAHILVPDQAKAKEVLAKYREQVAKDKAQEPKIFRDLVMQYSTDDQANKLRGGDLQYFSADAKNYPKELVDAAFKLKNTGEVSAPVKTARGWHILKLMGRRPALTRTFDEVKRQIQNRLYRDRRQQAQKDYVEGLKNKSNVQIFADRLDKVKIDTTPGAGMMPSPHGFGPRRMPMGHPPVGPGARGPHGKAMPLPHAAKAPQPIGAKPATK